MTKDQEDDSDEDGVPLTKQGTSGHQP